jgi:hypothetical protein
MLTKHMASVRVCGTTRGTWAEDPHAHGEGWLPVVVASVRKLPRNTGASAADTHARGEGNH